MIFDLLWVTGPSRSGKTARLVEQFCLWVEAANHQESFYTKSSGKKSTTNTLKRLFIHPSKPGILVFAANNELQRELADKIVTATQGKFPIRVKTPLTFFQEEVILFFPLLVELLGLKAQFPVRLRPETEQELARRLWRPRLDDEVLRRAGVNEYRFVRRVIDLFQLAAVSGNRCEDITSLLAQGLGSSGSNLEPEFYSELIIEWRDWCLERGFLTYGVITELYYHHLLPNSSYQRRLIERYQAILADDVGDYPAVARDLFEVLIAMGALGAFSYNPDSIVRLGLGADPVYLESLAERCQVETLTPTTDTSIGDTVTTQMVELVSEPMTLLNLPGNIQSIQTTSRASLLRQTAETVVKAVKLKQVEPKDVAIIAPGLDAIAEYTLSSILSKQNIYVNLLNNQRPLIASPLIRALLTLISLIYPGNGRLVDRDAVAEMLVVLSRGNLVTRGDNDLDDAQDDLPTVTHYPHIDPVRAGLLADYCFVPHPDAPNLLPATSFDRWDRLGYAATKAYEQILQWIEIQRSRQQERVIPSPISLLYAAIEKFFLNVTNLPYDEITTLRELLETAQHYWEIDTRLRSQRVGEGPGVGVFATNSTIAEFIQLLRRGTIVSYPYPVRPVGPAANAVTISTIFQYRSSRKSHSWHFWLDAGSHLWAKGGAATLYGANLFLRDRLGQPWTAEDETLAENQRVKRILADLLARVSDRLYLCHSELAVNGQEQLGPLLPLVNAALPPT